MRETTHEFAGYGRGTLHYLTLYEFGAPDARPHIHIQGGLHADEGPGMLTARILCDRLVALEAAGLLHGRVTVVPAANPVGLSQFSHGSQEGRFDNYDGRNFNRGYPDLTEAVGDRVADDLGYVSEANSWLIRDALRKELLAWRALTPTDHLKRLLMSFAIDADVVLDLHCDGEAELHLYTQPTVVHVFAPLSAFLAARAMLIAEVSGDNPFDEAVARPWVELAHRFPDKAIPIACASATIELRGRADVSRKLAATDAKAIENFLAFSNITGAEKSQVPDPSCVPTPLAGSEALTAPMPGLINYVAQLGETVSAGDLIAEIIDPLTGMTAPVRATTSGIFYARADSRIAEAGKRLGKIAAHTPRRLGLLLSP